MARFSMLGHVPSPRDRFAKIRFVSVDFPAVAVAATPESAVLEKFAATATP
jgi:hypothetical protein